MLNNENDLKKSNTQKRYSPDEKLEIIKYAKKEGNTEASIKFGVTRNSVRIWRKMYEKDGIESLMSKSSRPNHSPKKTSKWIIDKIISIKKEKQELGSKGMSDHLKRFENIDLSKTTVSKIFKKHKLQDGDAGYAENSYMVKGDKDKQLEKNIESELGEWERFSRPNPNDLWQMDIMSFYIRGQHKVYLISALDDCSRMIINWGLYKNQTADNVLETLRGGLAKNGAPKEILTDQGAQFKHWGGVTKFEKLLKKLKIEHIKARSHHPQTCGKIERFHKSIHRELIDKDFFYSQEQAIEKISRYIEHYNYARPHSALDGFTPSDRYFGVIDAVKKYLNDSKKPKNEVEENDESFKIGSSSKIYLIGKFLGQDIRIQETLGNISIHLDNKLMKEISLSAPLI
jgi:transposase InsO family protein/transposase-like protein